jgi:predicted NBD/HSP70 family sugar kinase
MVLAISLGSESLRAALVDPNGRLHCEVQEDPTPNLLGEPPRALLRRIRETAVKVLDQAFLDSKLWSGDEPSLRLLGVGVAWPCPLDRIKRPGGSALGAFEWTRANKAGKVVPVTERVAAEFGGPFTPERSHALNDVNAHAIAMAFRQARESALEPDEKRWRIALVVRVGGGLGAATIQLAPHRRNRLSFIDSRLIAGANGFAGELGHLPIAEHVIAARNESSPFPRLAPLDYETARCTCGRRHHLEAFASGAAVVQRLKASGYEIPDETRGNTSMIRSLFEEDPDQEKLHAVRDVGRILGAALAGPVLMLDPHSITLTGSLASEELKQGILLEREIWGHAIGDSARIVYVSGHNGAFAGVRGVGLAVLRRHVYRQFEHGPLWIRNQSFEFKPSELAELAERKA